MPRVATYLEDFGNAELTMLKGILPDGVRFVALHWGGGTPTFAVARSTIAMDRSGRAISDMPDQAHGWCEFSVE